MIEFAFVFLFTAAGIGAALLALRVAGDAWPVRLLAGGFVALALANLGLQLWPMLADDPAGAARRAGIAAVLGLAVWGYVLLLRRARRMAADRRDGT